MRYRHALFVDVHECELGVLELRYAQDIAYYATGEAHAASPDDCDFYWHENPSFIRIVCLKHDRIRH